MKKNQEIYIKAKESGVYFWKVAEVLNISDSTLCRKLRKELSEMDKQKILKIIEDISIQQKNESEAGDNGTSFIS